MKRIITALLIFAVSVVPAFASVDSELASVKADLKQKVKEEALSTILAKYPIGAVYQTNEDITAEELSEELGGEWREISYAFLWATDGTQDYTVDENGDFIDDKTEEAIDPLHKLGLRGGKEHYEFMVGVGTDGDSVSFWTDEESVYGTATAILSGLSATASTLSRVALATEGDAPVTTIMPPHTVVRTFERTD